MKYLCGVFIVLLFIVNGCSQDNTNLKALKQENAQLKETNMKLKNTNLTYEAEIRELKLKINSIQNSNEKDMLLESLSNLEGFAFEDVPYPHILYKDEAEQRMLNAIKDAPINIGKDEHILSMNTSFKDEQGNYHIEYKIYKEVN
ncbi:hypothetical protein EJF36_12435 [Bacillus sp. HMF5848]|uniref:hypothetical protein n=1 Tax=Bacillus sp. HMF5848 TaxID=2495421 RepID=UPI000F7860D6|nr:hypothetical protein [Bacillus sp. HMF5848]RSK27618.1 hypothetical protein EJF36_12435 [Bacillus sp. HMF5848]